MRLVALTAALGLALAPAAAAATDLVYIHRNGPEVLAPFHGFAHWQLQARCSGLMKAQAERSGRGERGVRARTAADYFEQEAVKRYMADRGVDQAKAQAVVAYYEATAREEFEEQAGKRGIGAGRTPATLYLSECAAFAELSSPPAATPPRVFLTDTQDEGVVCENTAQVGSRMAKRTCRVKRQASDESKDARDTTRRIQDMGGCRSSNVC